MGFPEMDLSSLDAEKIREIRNSIKLMTITEKGGDELPRINFHSENDICQAFYQMLKYRDQKFWEENKEILNLIKNHIRNNLNKRKLN